MAQRFDLALKYVEQGFARKQFPNKPELSNDDKVRGN